MKRITFVSAGFGSGGAEHQCAQLINMLVDKGYDVTIASFGDIQDHYVISPNAHRIALAPRQSTIKKILAVEKFLLSVQTDVVFAFSQRLSCITLPTMLMRPRIKVISSERNFTIGQPDKFERILIKTGLYLRANYVVPNNYSQGEYLANRMPPLKNKIHVITNYTDTNTYVSTPVPDNRVLKIGVFCRVEKQKNFHRFLDALYILNQRTDRKYHIDWYGNQTFTNSEQMNYYHKGLEKIKEYKLDGYISLREPTKDVASLIPTFDVMCLPSLHEGFSNSISEYICCGRPVICSDVSDNSVMVKDGVNGYLFNPLDVESIVQAFIHFFSSTYEERSIMGIKSREIAQKLFDKEKFIGSYINLIEE